MSQWQSIETAPKDGKPILLWQSGVARHWPDSEWPYTGRFGAWDNDEQQWLDEDGGRIKGPTYWMPIPEPPLKGGG